MARNSGWLRNYRNTKLEKRREHNESFVASRVVLPSGAIFTKCKPAFAFALSVEQELEAKDPAVEIRHE